MNLPAEPDRTWIRHPIASRRLATEGPLLAQCRTDATPSVVRVIGRFAAELVEGSGES